MPKRINFSRHIELQWLDLVAEWAAQGLDATEIHSRTDLMLQPSISSSVNRRKTRNQLVKLWSAYYCELESSFNDFAIQSVNKSVQPFFVLHWGMLVAKNRFFADVARFVGRREKLSDSFTYAQVQKSTVELYGDTETVKRSLRSVLQTLVDFELLERKNNKTYLVKKLNLKIEPKYKSWLLQALMHNQNFRSRSLKDLLDDLVWFPFVFTVSVNELETTWFDLHQQGNDLVLFKK